jgi:ubiquinone/menaquinone biosynthesis C-methylase UbiE
MKKMIKKIIGTQYEWESHIENIFRMFDKNMRTFIPRNMLDVGSGNGDRTIRIAAYFNIQPSNIHGVDNDEKRLTEGHKRYIASKVDLEKGALPYKKEMFDLVVSNQVLEHLKNFKEIINEMIRVTVKEGYIVIGIPNLAHLINRIYLLFGIQPMCIHLDGPHVRSYTHRSFLNLLKSINDVKIIDYTGALMYPLPVFVSNYLSKYLVGLSGYTCYLLQKE